MSVTPITKPFAADDIPTTLRQIADDYEAGEFGLITTCLVVMGHTNDRPTDDGDKLQYEDHHLFGCGPRCDVFTARGLLLTVATQPLNPFGSEDDLAS